MTYLDTHVVAWLDGGRLDLLTDPVRRVLRDDELVISPMVRLELQFLYEIGRVATPAGAVVAELARAIGLTLCPQSFAAVIERAEAQAWTRDPFDRIIVAQAALRRSRLVTKDETIRAQYRHAVWS